MKTTQKILVGSLLGALATTGVARAAISEGPAGDRLVIDAPVEASVTGNCKSTELTFKNGTSGAIEIPQSGHRVKNPGSLEGWNKLTLGASKAGLGAGSSWSNVVTLSVKCVTDAEFEIKWSDAAGDHMKTFSSVNISDKAATFTLD